MGPKIRRLQCAVVCVMLFAVAGCRSSAEPTSDASASSTVAPSVTCDVESPASGQRVWPKIARPGGVVHLVWPELGRPVAATIAAGDDLWLLPVTSAHVEPRLSDNELVGPGVTFPPTESIGEDDGLVRLPEALEAGCYKICDVDDAFCWPITVDDRAEGAPDLSDLELASLPCGLNVPLLSRRGDRLLLLPFGDGLEVESLPDEGVEVDLDRAIEVVAPAGWLPSSSLGDLTQSCTDVSLDVYLGDEIEASGRVRLLPDGDRWVVVTGVELDRAAGFSGEGFRSTERWTPWSSG